MAIPDTVLSQLEIAAARSIQVQADFTMQHGMAISKHEEEDGRLMSGFLAGQLFNAQLVQAKSAFHTPVEPQAAPLPAAQAAK